ncbi:glycosyltransferase family 2 protein [bacterium]|nr:glycosyltransferase family 2 protein [bacterium]
MKDVSVIIRNKNEERWIGHAIQSALEHLLAPEIIVINNNSTDDSMDIVRSFRHDPALEKSEKNYSTVKVGNINDYTPGKALNLGVSMCVNEVILILSAHAIINFIDSEKIYQYLDSYACVFGKQIPIYNGRKITPRYIWSHFSDNVQENMYSDLEDRYFLHNAACFYTKSALTQLPFDENIAGKEDRIWAKECVGSNMKYLYTPELQVHHHFTIQGNTWRGVG